MHLHIWQENKSPYYILKKHLFEVTIFYDEVSLSSKNGSALDEGQKIDVT